MATAELTGAPERANFPAIAPGHHLAPVAIGYPGAEQKIVYVQCPDFCVTNHVASWVHFIEDVDHTGEEFAVHVPSFLNEAASAYTLSATIGCDPMSSDAQMRDAHVVIGDEGSVDSYLTPDMADATADDLEKLVAKLRGLARTARLHNAHAEVAA